MFASIDHLRGLLAQEHFKFSGGLGTILEVWLVVQILRGIFSPIPCFLPSAKDETCKFPLFLIYFFK